MADVNISKYRASVVRDGSKPASPGFVVSEGQDPVNPPGTNNFVPYTGATANVELGEYGLESGFVTLDTTPTNTPTDQGTIYWDDSRSTAALIMNGTLQHIGQDSFFYVKNSSGSTIPKGTCVGFAGTDGGSGHLLVTPFLANGSVPSTYFMGVTCESIANGSFGQVMHFGELTGINTSGFTAGALLYASSTVAGAFQTTAPVAPNNIILVAAAVNSKNNGAIVVRPTLGSNINSDEGVKITSPTTGDLLQLQAGGLWENKTLAQVIGSAYVPSTRTLTINGTAFDLSANRSWTVGDVRTDGSYSNPSWITALAWSKITGTPTTLSGYGITDAVPSSRTITINGVTQDLSANRTFNVGTVTSVGLSSATSGVTIGSTPVTSSGTITLAIATASGSQQGLLSASDWTTFNNKQNALTNPVTGTGTTNYLPKFTGSTTIGNSQIFDNGTFVGIGTGGSSIGNDFVSIFFNSSTARSQAINIKDTNASASGSTFEVYRKSDDTYLGNIRRNGTDDAIFVGGNSYLALGSGNTERVRITSGGNLLVGTTSDNGARLQVSGIVNSRSASTSAGLGQVAFIGSGEFMSTGSLSGYFWENRSGGVTSNSNWYGWYTTSGVINLWNGGGNLLSINGTSGAATFSSSVTANGTATFLGQFGNGNNVNEKVIQFLRASASTDIVNIQGINAGVGAANIAMQALGGNVLIGTSTDVGDRVNVNGSIRVPQTFFFRYDGDTGIFGSATSITGGSASQLGIRAASDILFATNGANERMRITSGGNVLIGTTSDAGQRLQVSGSIYLLTGGNRNIRIGSATNYYYDLQSTNDDFQIIEAGATPRLTIKYPNGNVGIGTSSPTTLLQVEGSAPIFTMNRTSGGFINRINFSSGGTNYASIISDAGAGEQRYSIGPSAGWGGYHTFYTDTTERMRITSSGNVGIGTTTFAYSPRLAVASVGQNSIAIQTTDTVQGSAGTILYLGTGASTGNSTFGIIRALGNGGTAATNLVLQESGNVLIGTTTDGGYKLDVSGQIRSFSGTPLVLSMSSNPSNDAVVAARWQSGTGMEMRYFPDFAQGFIDNTYQATAGQVFGDIYFRQNVGGTMTSRMMIQARTGNVGIGTSSPTFRLDVQNNTQAIARVLDTSTNASLIMQAGSGSTMKVTAYNYASSTALPLYIQVDGANTIMQSGGGNVLIGTTTDNGAKLNVNGTIRTSNPTGSTSDGWLLGRALVSGTSTPDRWIRVQIGNLYYDILAVYMGSV